MGKEPDAWNTDLARATRGGGITFLSLIAHNKLTVEGEAFAYVPQLAVEQISVEKGTWRINPDHTMATTWRVHPNVKWHDGVPFTADDLMFTLAVMKDPEVPNTVAAGVKIIEAAELPDPYTFVIHWAGPYVDADQALWLFPMPRHLLEDAYRRDKASFPSHPWMTTEFVGLGAYRLARWERGSHMEFVRFDDYFRGRPPFDSVVMRFMGDENGMVAGVLAGQIDFIPPTVNINLDAALEVRRRWEGTGNRVAGSLSGRFITVEVQHRVELARPANGLVNRDVRQAFYRAIDRDQLAEAITAGLGPPADSWFFPGHELRPEVEAWIPRFPYDVAAAERQLEQVGWTRGADGILVSQQTGEPILVLLAYDRVGQRTAGIVADYWRAAGARVDEVLITAERLNDLEALSKLPGTWMGTQNFANMYTDRFHSANTAGPSNRWAGRNRSGYNNPKVDAILDRLVATATPAERLPLQRNLLQEQGSDLVVMPLHWEYNPYFVVKGLRGVVDGNAWNFFDWDKE
jgi:peptide/nickel transport system substrate-binding protein